MSATELRQKIADRTACVAVIGCGYVGLPLAVAFARGGFPVVALDLDEKRIAQLRKGSSYIRDVPDAELAPAVRDGRLKPTTDYDSLRAADVIFVAVQTPFDRAKQPDLRYIVKAAEGISTRLRKGQLVILESTTYPGTTDEVMKPILERSGLRAGQDFFLAFSPERIDPGNTTYRINNTAKVVGGVDPESTDLAVAILDQITEGHVHAVSSARVAELTKLLENTFRSVNIALVNELAMLCDRMHLDVWEVIDAAATKPYGFMPFYPGPGVGGHCLPPGQSVYARVAEQTGPFTVEELWQTAVRDRRAETIGDVEVITNPGFATLGIGIDGPPRWEAVTHIARRRFVGDLVHIATVDGRRLTVTDQHPLLVVESGVTSRVAADVGPGDLLPVFAESIPGVPDDIVVDLIPFLNASQSARTRVRIRDGHWSEHEAILRDRFGAASAHDWTRGDYLPLLRYLEIENDSDVPARERIDLWTGRGPGCSRFAAITRITPAIARLVGYYATEGCISVDGKSSRVRFSFHSEEHETVSDLISLLEDLGLRYSTSRDPNYASLTVKVSSALFAIFIRDALSCGVDSYDAAVPRELLAASIAHRTELLTGLLRGDGSVDAKSGPRRYRKNGRDRIHANASASLSFWTSSPVLERQFLYLLQSLGIRSSIQRRRRQEGADIHILGAETVRRLQPLFADAKRARLDSCFAAKQRWPRSRGTLIAAGQHVAAVRAVERRRADTLVYSIETADSHTFAMAEGVFVHNCIPVDPYYLAWKAREFDFHTRFIELAAETNLAMPFFTVGRIRKLLDDGGKSLRGARVLTLGAAFKRDIDDARQSPAVRVMEILSDQGADLQYHDPYVPSVHLEVPLFANGRGPTLESVALDDETLRRADCVVILVAHSGIDYGRVVRLAPRVFDAVNATRGLPRNEHVERL